MMMVVFVTMIVAIRVVVMQKTTYIETNQNKVMKDP